MKRKFLNKNNILFFAAGTVIGGMIVSGIFFTVAKKYSEKTGKNTAPSVCNSCIEQKNNDTAEFFPPTFTKESCRHWGNYAGYLMRGGYDHTNWDMSMASGLISFLTKVELFIFVNEKARSLKGRERQEFIAKHRQWMKWFEKECREPDRYPDGTVIEGTMAISVQAGKPGYLIEQYLNRFPDRAKLKYDYIAEYEKRRKNK